MWAENFNVSYFFECLENTIVCTRPHTFVSRIFRGEVTNFEAGLHRFKIKTIFTKNLSITHDLSIIIVSYNCKAYLEEALESINKYANVRPEIIVVDNASSDNTVEELGAKFPQVTFIANSYNAGFSAANNKGVQQSRSDLLLFLNPDAKLLDPQLENIVRLFDKKEKLVIGPKILNPDGTLQDSLIEIPSGWDVIKESLFLSYISKKSQQTILATGKFALSGACIMMSKSLFNKIGGFDENLFWMDDVDLCYRAMREGAHVRFLAEWSVMHTIGVSSSKNYNKVIANQLISKLKFFRKNSRWFDLIISAIFVQLHILLRIPVFLVLSVFNSLARKKLVAYLYTQWSFWRYTFAGNNKVV